MQVNLAGYNIDSSLIRKLQTESATPEVISAAYARISRSEKSIAELREQALKELEKARRSNQKIIFELGHSSVAEHSVFNFDLIGISRLVTELVETIRFASFTEKSQRYVAFSDDFVIPEELEKPTLKPLREEYIHIMQALFNEYKESLKAIQEYYKKVQPQLKKSEIEGKAKEDARYILPLATKTQLGMTINARSLENLLRRLITSPLAEAHELYNLLLQSVKELCPSLIRYIEKEDFKGTFDVAKIKTDIIENSFDKSPVKILEFSVDADDKILAALLFEQCSNSFSSCLETITKLDETKKKELWAEIFNHIQPWSKMPRAFELVDCSFELAMSECCWSQFKRHRVATLLKQKAYSLNNYIFPPIIYTLKREDKWLKLLKETNLLKQKLTEVSPDLVPYARLNAEQVRVLVKMNLREIYHFIRLRADINAQWEIRNLACSFAEYIRPLAPFATSYLCGKSELESLVHSTGKGLTKT
ncbi:MAG TPA: FAD-dependent thymidylate synthase [Candidatus Syntrophosphaera thermopropionivorans]|nr:FAD-dependent thymidylate synthase [Candidatus Syntrophosphaera thermopropionivorans]